jgi:hypothetical protein
MSQIVMDRIQRYVTRNPDMRRKLVSIVDAFEYVEEQKDQALLTRLLNRMVLSPSLGSAVCALGVGYEQAVENLTPETADGFNRVLKSVGKVACQERANLPRLRVALVPAVVDEDMESLVRVAGLEREACVAANNRFRGYKCDVAKEAGSDVCGMNTNFSCEKGVAIGTANCEIGAGSRCRLSLVGKQNRARVDARARASAMTRTARDNYRARAS